MDRTAIIVLVLCMAAFFGWFFVMNKLYPPRPVTPGATNTAASVSATNPPSISTSTVTATPPAITSSPSTALSNAPVPVADTNVAEQLLVLTNENARYTFTSHGGGLKLIELLGYPETVSNKRTRRTETNQLATLDQYGSAPTLAVLGGSAIQGDGIFKLSPAANGVRAEKTLTNGLTIVKEFTLSSNYVVTASVKLENRSSHAIELPPQEWVIGTATPMGPRDDGSAVGVMWYNGGKIAGDAGTATYFSSKGFMCMPKTPPAEYREGASNVVWAAAHNQFFALAVVPNAPAQSIVVRRLDLPRPTGEEAKYVSTNGPPPQGYSGVLIYPAQTIAANQTFERQILIYAGPKEYQTLARISDTFHNNLDQLMNFNWFGFVSKALLLGMNWMHQVLRLPYGWTIVAITFTIKLIFWPFTAASTRTSKRMAALQPQLAELKKKYGDDAMKLQKKTMELYGQHGVKPMASCFPMLLQIPVFFGFLQMIRTAIELRGAPWVWVADLSKPDTLFIVPGLGFIPVLGIQGQGLPFNPLPLLMGATMLWQARLTPPSPGMDPTQQAIMKYLPLIFLVGLYNFSAGMTLYWTVNNLLTILQTKLTKTIPTPATPPPGGKPAVLTPPQKKRK
jgi:YidC/Oxa1 family membrane protein insertase